MEGKNRGLGKARENYWTRVLSTQPRHLVRYMLQRVSEAWLVRFILPEAQFLPSAVRCALLGRRTGVRLLACSI